MERHLEITVVAGALAIVCGYAFRERLRDGDTQIQFKMIYRKDNPGTFWTIMIMLGVIEAGFVGLAIVNLATWLGAL